MPENSIAPQQDLLVLIVRFGETMREIDTGNCTADARIASELLGDIRLRLGLSAHPDPALRLGVRSQVDIGRRPGPPTDDVWLLAVHPALTEDLVAWFAARGLEVGRIPGDASQEPTWTSWTTWTTTPTDDMMAKGGS